MKTYENAGSIIANSKRKYPWKRY